MPRKSAISRVSCGWALPENTFRSPNPVDINPSPLSGLLILLDPVDVSTLRPQLRPSHGPPSHPPSRASPATARQAWLGRKDSNLRIRDPKSRALPLGHAPPREFWY